MGAQQYPSYKYDRFEMALSPRILPAMSETGFLNTMLTWPRRKKKDSTCWTLTLVYQIEYPLTMDKDGKRITEWESLCKQCGTCCFEKVEDESGTIFFTRIPCRYLDVSTRRCKIYDRRFEIYPDCIQLTEALVKELDWLHDDCGYREGLGITRRSPLKKRKRW